MTELHRSKKKDDDYVLMMETDRGELPTFGRKARKMCQNIEEVSQPLEKRALDCWKNIIPENLGVYILKQNKICIFTVIESQGCSSGRRMVERRLTSAFVDEIIRRGKTKTAEFITSHMKRVQQPEAASPSETTPAEALTTEGAQKKHGRAPNKKLCSETHKDKHPGPEPARAAGYDGDIRILIVAQEETEESDCAGMVTMWAADEIMRAGRLNEYSCGAMETMCKIKNTAAS